MLPEGFQLLSISVLFPVCFILVLNHRLDNLIFGSEAPQVACGIWAKSSVHRRGFSCLYGWNLLSVSNWAGMAACALSFPCPSQGKGQYCEGY
jgi:hypothetical protein